MLQNDNDIVRGVGYVTIYSAYTEERIDQLLFALINVEAFPESEQRKPISWKIEKAKSILPKLEFRGRDDLLAHLDAAKIAFENRNEIIHGRIYPSYSDESHDLISGRPSTSDRPVDAAELYLLANNFYKLLCEIERPLVFQIPKAVSSLQHP
jgi:hypothetical protein